MIVLLIILCVLLTAVIVQRYFYSADAWDGSA